MQDFEKLGVFYLGRRFDPTKRAPTDDLLLYDARDLTTHAVIVGMTGSGKTGLGVALLEEAAIDAIPAIVIDPKGDLANLALAFPELRAADFRPFLDEDEARRKGVGLDELAQQTADAWRSGLAASGQDAARVRRFRDAADLAVYTPGSSAGIQLSLLRSLTPPPPAILADGEALRDRIHGVVSGLLALVDVEADPIKSREHILLSNILDRAFRAGRSLDLAELIRQVQKPPFTSLGVLDLESFFPAKDRFDLAMAFNNLLASPGFASWMEGEPLDVARLLYTPAGKPRLAILSIAHLTDAQRMFFVSVLLNEVIGWMRQQPGTSSLRAILYMDEIAGYFPPTAMPPTKRPMLTLLKQARAFGLGVVLATQNPVDLDYKGLGNAGTWFIGRLQTERDKLRLLDGLEGAAASAGHGFDRGRMSEILAGLGNRVFLMNNVHDDAPTLFQTRFALSYLRGPLTREQIRLVMAGRAGTPPVAPAPAPAPSTSSIPAADVWNFAPVAAAPIAPAADPWAALTGGTAAPSIPAAAPAASNRPLLPPDVPEFFLAPKQDAGGEVLYRPAIFASARLHFVNAKANLDEWEPHALLVPLGEDDADVDWSQATVYEGDDVPSLSKNPAATRARFDALPPAAARKASYEAWKKSFAQFLYEGKSVTLYRSTSPKALSKPGESEKDFRLRLAHAAREGRDADLEKLRKRYAPKLAALQEKIRRAEEKIAKEKTQYQAQTVDTAVSWGATILGALVGNKVASVGNIGRARSAVKGVTRTWKEKGDVGIAEADRDAAQAQLETLNAEMETELQAMGGTIDPSALEIEAIEVRPRKGDITVGTVALAWAPWQAGEGGMPEPLF